MPNSSGDPAAGVDPPPFFVSRPRLPLFFPEVAVPDSFPTRPRQRRENQPDPPTAGRRQ